MAHLDSVISDQINIGCNKRVPLSKPMWLSLQDSPSAGDNGLGSRSHRLHWPFLPPALSPWGSSLVLAFLTQTGQMLVKLPSRTDSLWNYRYHFYLQIIKAYTPSKVLTLSLTESSDPHRETSCCLLKGLWRDSPLLLSVSVCVLCVCLSVSLSLSQIHSDTPHVRLS